MAPMKRPRLAAVSALGGHRLALTFVDGRHFELSMANDIQTYPGLKPLSAPDVFAQVALGDSGWSAEWVEQDIQVGADTLLLDALAQNAEDENTRTFLRWRASTGLPLQRAADALGVAQRTITRYSAGLTPVPRTLALACVGWETLQHKARAGR